MMEPVAWHRSSDFCFHFSLGSERPKNGTSNPNEWEPLVRLSDAEARIATLEARLKEVAGPCSLGVGCEQYGVCYADAHGQPDQCGKPSYECEALRDARRIADHDKKLWLAAEARAEAAEARIKELEAENQDLIGRLCAVWNSMTTSVIATSLEDLQNLPLICGGTLPEQIEDLVKQRDAAEALLKEAGKALEPFARWPGDFKHAVDKAAVWTVTLHSKEQNALKFADFRAARAIHHKIGVKDE